MCKAFSAIVKQNGEVLWEFAVDSHEDLLRRNNLEDNENRPEFMDFVRLEITPRNGSYLNPDEWILRVDEHVKPLWFTPAFEVFAFEAHAEWLALLDKLLVRKEIVHSLRDVVPPKTITKKHLQLLREWTLVKGSVGASVGDSVRDLVGGSVWGSVGDSVWGSVWASVRALVRGSVWASVGDSVGALVWGSVGDSVWDSVWGSVGDSVTASVAAYTGSFFKLRRKAWRNTVKIKTKDYPFISCVKLWELGLVSSFDGTIWRLHGGVDAKVLWTGTREALNEQAL